LTKHRLFYTLWGIQDICLEFRALSGPVRGTHPSGVAAGVYLFGQLNTIALTFSNSL